MPIFIIFVIRLRFTLLLTTLLLILTGTAWPCHRGGPMGFAKSDPGAFSLDITLSPTYILASTSGTAVCKNWDYSRKRRFHFIETQWAFLNEDIARGRGFHLSALMKLIGCEKKNELLFANILRKKYSLLFLDSEKIIDSVIRFEIILENNSELLCAS